MKSVIFSFIFSIFHTPLFSQNKELIKINCDSIYSEKGYSVSLEFDAKDESWDESKANAVFSFSRHQNGKTKIIHQEKLFSQFKNIKFIDFNGDGVKDILVENTSDVRSNLTYHLFIVDFKNQKLRKIEGFEAIKNPNYLPKYHLIDCFVLSGRNWTSFYKIEGNKVKDFGYIVEDGEDDNGNDLEYDKNYQLTLSKILKSEKAKK